jgi:hypothetical protein
MTTLTITSGSGRFHHAIEVLTDLEFLGAVNLGVQVVRIFVDLVARELADLACQEAPVAKASVDLEDRGAAVSGCEEALYRQ